MNKYFMTQQILLEGPEVLPGFATLDRLEILKLLAGYKCLTTRQVWHCLGARKSLRRVKSDLARLEQSGAVLSFEVEPERGTASPRAWLLLKPGADLINLERYGTHYRRRRPREWLHYLDLQLALEQSVKNAECTSWSLIPPQTYNHSQPLPDRTPQFYRLAQAVTGLHYQQTGRWPADLENGPHTLSIPLKANDYVASCCCPGELTVHRDKDEAVIKHAASGLAVVLILSPVRATGRFWESRCQKYQNLVRQLYVFGVFENSTHAGPHKELIKSAGLKVTLLSRVSTLLDSIYNTSRLL